MKHSKRVTAGMMALTALLFALFFTGVQAAELDHDCSGDHCPVCQMLVTARALSKIMVSAAFLAGLFLAAPAFAEAPVREYGSFFRKKSLVSLKVKLSN